MEAHRAESLYPVHISHVRELKESTQPTLGQLSLVIAATYTADPLGIALGFWMERLGLAAEVTLAPYAQVMQQLLDSESALSRNKQGCNILLIRLEDSLRDRPTDSSVEDNLRHIRRVGNDILYAVRTFKTGSSAPLLVVLAPSPSSLPEGYIQPLEEIRRFLLEGIAACRDTYCWTHADITRLYPVDEHEDPHADRIGHIPYSSDYFAAMATVLARCLAALNKPSVKVIAVDCDNTLWKGICGEDGASGVELTPAHLDFQKLLVRQQEAGILLCLCSKNNPGDVSAVFSAHPEMPLREEHVIASRVNWGPKSANLQSLSDELGLGLDSFAFIDDSPMECAEVRTHCPTVLSLCFPQGASEIKEFLDQTWIFDRYGVTDDARRRTLQYKQNRARHAALEQSSDLEQFLASLRLEVSIEPMKATHLDRVAELTQRTNQFNLTTIRRRAPEIGALCDSGELHSLVVHVQDRFGDYGLVGAVLYRLAATALEVDTFILSCRVLGRRVEHRIIAELGRLAIAANLNALVLPFRQTARNAPAWEFLHRSFSQYASQPATNGAAPKQVRFTIPTEHTQALDRAALDAKAIRLEFEASADSPSSPSVSSSTAFSMPTPVPSRPSLLWHESTLTLRRVPDILKAMTHSSSKTGSPLKADQLPRTPFEHAVADIWASLLNLQGVGIRDNFFERGGDSIRAVQAVSRMISTLGRELPLHEFFANPTVEAVAAALSEAASETSSIQPADRTRPLPLSWAQRRLWFIDQLEGSTAYHIAEALSLRGDLDPRTLEQALDTLLSRHEALRTVFPQQDGEPVQVILPELAFPLRKFDLRAVDEPRREVESQRHYAEELTHPFNLATGPLIRGRLLQLSDSEHVLLVTLHHMVSDGWSIGILIRELAALYGRSEPLPEIALQYADYACWQRAWPPGAQLKRQLEYWKTHLQGAPELLELPTDKPRPPVQSHRGATVKVAFGSTLTAALESLSTRLNLTLAMTLYAAWAILLWRLSGQDDVVMGMPTANRRRTQFEGLIGFFVNTLAIRVRLDDDARVADLLQQVKETLLGANAHQDVPFEQVVEALQPTRTLSHSPVFQAMLVLQNTPRDPIGLPGLILQAQEVPPRTAQFDLLLSLQRTSDGLTGTLNYASDLFEEPTLHRWVDSLQAILEGLTNDPRRPLGEITASSATQRRQVLQAFNANTVTYPQDVLLHELLEEQAQRTPDAQAVNFEGATLTYAVLHKRANQLARHLQARGVGPDRLVGICVERSLEMVIGLLAVLKAGGAYVPLDPTYPAERLAYMLSDAQPTVLLTQARLRETLPTADVEVIALDEDWSQIELQSSDPIVASTIGLRPHHLAYVIYTSGSTGQPKGAMNEHRGVINRLQWMQDQYRLSSADTVLQKTPFSFDVSVWEFFWTLMTGARLVVARPEGHKDPTYLRQLIEATGVTTLHFVPSMLQSFLSQPLEGACPSLRHIVCSGEELPASLRAKCFEVFPDISLSNLYGPTEAAVDVTYWECRPEERGARVPIGYPISNIRMYVLDRHRQPVPIGVAGEIHIAGVGVGRGYWRKSELTAEKFLKDPFYPGSHSRMYRTGDLGRWRPDGAIEYLGRNDFQVKIRGFRIELGEIESHLAHHPGIQEAAVLAREDIPGEKRLVAYLVPGPTGRDSTLSVEHLRAHLKHLLPDHMVPSAFVLMERLPLSPNGKLDRRALPAPERTSYVTRQYEPPRGRAEETLAEIWQNLLPVEKVGRQDHFFELGGHSLMIVRMLEGLRRAGLSVELRQVFERPVLADLATVLGRDSARQTQTPPNLIPAACGKITPQMLPLVELEAQHIERIEAAIPGGAPNIQDIYPLAPLQDGILFHYLLDKERGDTYARALLLSLPSRAKVDELATALQTVIDRHDVLRTAVLWEGLPRPVQVVQRRAALSVETVERLEERMTPERLRLDLGHAPLIRLAVAPAQPQVDTVEDSPWYVLLQTHHLICDNESLDLLLSEISACLQGRLQTLPPPAPYRDHVAQTLANRTLDEETFFREKLGDVEEPTATFGVLEALGNRDRTDITRRALDTALAQKVRATARRLGVSAATLFHAAWSLVTARTTGRDDVVFGTVLLGRLQGTAGAQRILGMFINTLPLRLKLQSVTAQDLVQQTQRELIDLLSHEQSSLAVAQRCSAISGPGPLFNSLLNYRHHATPAELWSPDSGIQQVAKTGGTNYPILISVDDFDTGFELELETDPRIEPLRIADYLETAMASLCSALEQAPELAALSLTVLPERERRQVIELFNATDAPYPQEKLLHQLFEEQVERTPDGLAVLFEDRSLTYEQLNSKANQLARHLLDKGVRPDQPVGLCIQRSLEMVIGLLGILKAGGAYVPLDPDYPTERLQYMLKDAAPQVLLTQERLKPRLPQCSAEIVALDVDWPGIAQHATTNLSAHILGLHDRHLAYVIYTSGSTGQPKGAMNEHRGVVNRILWMQDQYGLKATDRVLQKTPFSFDVSVWEFYWTLMSGACLVVARPEGHKDPAYLRELIRDRGVTTLHFVPSMLQIFLEHYPTGDCPSLQHIVCSGEELPGALQRKCFEFLPDVRLSNLYGPTEAAVDVTVWECRPEDGASRVPIGHPISNSQMYVLDRHVQPLPIGVAGEIHIGGIGVGRGYLNRPELTRDRFIPNPFSPDPQARLYRTGDLGRWRPDGNLEYLGRNDNQVKIRGFRIELGEIESRLAQHPQVREAAVLAREDIPGEKRLVAYIIPKDGPTVEALRTHLKETLPDHMVPNTFLFLERFPLSPNGKLDRRALPAPDKTYVTREYEAPRGAVEEVLAGIWQSLLQVARVGRKDNFFELGGHSLLIVRMMERLRQVGLHTEIRRVFESSSLADLASALSLEVSGEFTVPPHLIPPGCQALTPQMLPLVKLEPGHIDWITRSVPGGAPNIQDIYPLAPLQEGILFHHQLNPQGGDTYISPTLLEVSTRESLDTLISGLQKVIDHHDALRTAILWRHLPEPIQVVHRHVDLPVQEVSLDPNRNIREQLNEWTLPERQNLDLQQAPLVRLRIARDPSGARWYALLQFHHIVGDNTSQEIVASEVAAHFQSPSAQLPEPVPYRNHVAHSLQYAAKHDDAAFFHQKLGDVDEPTAPFGLLDVQGNGSRIEEASETLDPTLARAIRDQARRCAISPATVFHAAWALVVALASGRDDVVFGSVLLGRMQGRPGAERIVGMFINTLPLRLRLKNTTVKELLDQTQRELIELLIHEQASLVSAQRCSAVTGTAPLFTALLNYRHNLTTPEGHWSGLPGMRVLAQHARTNYPITLSIDDLGEGFAITAQTDRLIAPARITAYLRTALKSLIDSLERAPETPALALSVLPEPERNQVLQVFNATRADYPDRCLVHELFEDQVRRTPNHVAVEGDERWLTYAQLNSRANELARILLDRGIRPDEPVGICIDRRPEMVVGLLAILKAGGAYLPLDPNYPADRLRYMVEDATPKVVVTLSQLKAVLPEQANLLLVDGLSEDTADNLPSVALDLTPRNLVYVIYTSGSTGRPKGTAMAHRSMVNLIHWHREHARLGQAGQRTLQFAALSFDVAFQEVFTTLCTGGTLVLVDEWTRREPQALFNYLSAHSINRLFVPPLMLQGLAEVAATADTASVSDDLQDVITAGEQLRISPEISGFFTRRPSCQLHNHYGPTESHVVTALTLPPITTTWPTLPTIGHPLSNTRIYVLNPGQQPVPTGVAGEIFIGGVAVARGYYEKPDLTSSRFVQDPFGTASDTLYKTGDLGRWLPDGTLEYLGRNDYQVKIRGYRIETGEVEMQLARHPQVADAAVLAREDTPGDKRLVAYVIPDNTPGPTTESLRAHLQAVLPEYMIPSAFVTLDRFPTSPNGKLDRRALPAPDASAYTLQTYEPPEGEIEETLAGIWKELLRVDRVGRQDDFFQLGGHSLSASRVITRISHVLDVDLPLRALFEQPTVQTLSRRIVEEIAAELSTEAP